MAPVTDQVADELKALVRKLEDRVHELETRLGGSGLQSSSGSTANASQAMRMIIMGPPGAGERITASNHSLQNNPNHDIGKGTQAPRIKDKYCVCHLVWNNAVIYRAMEVLMLL